MPRSWFVLYSKPRAEKKTAERLERDGFEVFCPTRKVLKQWSDRKKWVQEPVLPSYLFVLCEEHERETVLQDPGAVRFVFWQKSPLTIREKELLEFKAYLEGALVEDVEWVKIGPGEKAVVHGGAFNGEYVEIIEESGKAVLVKFINTHQALLLKLNKSNLRPRNKI